MHFAALAFACLVQSTQGREKAQEDIERQSSSKESLAALLFAHPPAAFVSQVDAARTNAHPRLAVESRSEPAEHKGKKRDFLIANARNEVSVLKCATKAVLQQGLLETTGLPQICVAGESNAGKSSLINHLLQKKSLARASSVAGKTRSVDMMLVNNRIVVTDLPGLPSRDHQVAKIWEQSWRPLVFQYLRSCDDLLAMVYVHDVRWKASNQVREFLQEVRETTGLPIILVLTKDDRIIADVRGSKLDDDAALRREEVELRDRLMKRARKALDFDGVHLHYSVDNALPSSRKARRQLLRYIESLVKAGSKDEGSRMLEEIAASRMVGL